MAEYTVTVTQEDAPEGPVTIAQHRFYQPDHEAAMFAAGVMLHKKAFTDARRLAYADGRRSMQEDLEAAE